VNHITARGEINNLLVSAHSERAVRPMAGVERVPVFARVCDVL
jgi:hypothetical protein